MSQTKTSTPMFVYFFVALEGATDQILEAERNILAASIESLRLCTCNPEIFLITNSRFASLIEDLGINKIMIDNTIGKDNLDYSRVVLQHRLVREIQAKRGEENLLFVDHDILFSSDISHFFASQFDFGVTANFCHFELDQHYLPSLTGIASINAGVQLCKTTEKCIEILEKKIQLAEWAEEHKDEIPTPLHPSPLAWGCDQISMMLLLNREIYQKNRLFIDIDGAKVRAFSTNILNFSPDPETSFNLRQFFDHYIWHFKGPRKASMVSIWMKIRQLYTDRSI